MGLRESEAKIASLEASLASLESEDILQNRRNTPNGVYPYGCLG